MTALSEPTAVFKGADTGSAVVLGLLRRNPGGLVARSAVFDVLAALADEGWLLSVGAMYGRETRAMGYDVSFSSSCDAAVVFEAPTLRAAVDGTVRLERAGWERVWASEWLFGPREFAPVRRLGGAPDPQWGFVALWEWNDAWQMASAQERREYDDECDIAFNSDLASGADIAGRHRLDWASPWHHLGVWEVDDINIVDEAMREHERVADFKFTTSRHLLGRRVPLKSLFGARDDR